MRDDTLRPEEMAVTRLARRKRPDLLDALDEFLAGIDYELASPGQTSVPISDPAEATTLAHPAVVLDQRWQHGGQPGVETGDLVGVVVLQRAQVKPDFEDGPVSPDIGAPQVVDAKKLDVVQVFHVPKGLGGQRRGIRHR